MLYTVTVTAVYSRPFPNIPVVAVGFYNGNELQEGIQSLYSKVLHPLDSKAKLFSVSHTVTK